MRSVPAETERSLYGRRHQLPGESALRPSPLLGEPLLALDELDKAPREVQRACLKLLQGSVDRCPVERGEAHFVLGGVSCAVILSLAK